MQQLILFRFPCSLNPPTEVVKQIIIGSKSRLLLLHKHHLRPTFGSKTFAFRSSTQMLHSGLAWLMGVMDLVGIQLWILLDYVQWDMGGNHKIYTL